MCPQDIVAQKSAILRISLVLLMRVGKSGWRRIVALARFI